MTFETFSKRLDEVVAKMLRDAAENWPNNDSAKILGYDSERVVYLLKCAYGTLGLEMNPRDHVPWRKSAPGLAGELVDHIDALARFIRDTPDVYTFFTRHQWDIRLDRRRVVDELNHLLESFERIVDQEMAVRRIMELCCLLMVFCALDVPANMEDAPWRVA